MCPDVLPGCEAHVSFSLFNWNYLKDVAVNEVLCPCYHLCEPEELSCELSACCISALSQRIPFKERRAKRKKGSSLQLRRHCAEIATKEIMQV